MPVYRMLFVSLMTLALLVACSQNDTKETTEKKEIKNEASEETDQKKIDRNENEPSIINTLKEKNDRLESYHADVDMKANLDNNEEEELNAKVDYIFGEPPSLELTSFDTLRMVSVDGKTYFNNENAWVDVTDSVELNSLFHTTYDNAVQYFSDIFDELRRVEEDDEIKYVYKGNDGFVYNRLENYLQINFGTVDTSQHHTKVEFTMNSKEDVIENIEFSSNIEDQDGGINLEGNIKYSAFNQIKKITLPEIQ